jgi:hypothetical protein
VVAVEQAYLRSFTAARAIDLLREPPRSLTTLSRYSVSAPSPSSRSILNILNLTFESFRSRARQTLTFANYVTSVQPTRLKNDTLTVAPAARKPPAIFSTFPFIRYYGKRPYSPSSTTSPPRSVQSAIAALRCSVQPTTARAHPQPPLSRSHIELARRASPHLAPSLTSLSRYSISRALNSKETGPRTISGQPYSSLNS